MKKIEISEIDGIYIGHEQDFIGATGCTVILCPAGGICGVDVRGGSPGTRDTDALNPVNNRKKADSLGSRLKPPKHINF